MEEGGRVRNNNRKKGPYPSLENGLCVKVVKQSTLQADLPVFRGDESGYPHSRPDASRNNPAGQNGSNVQPAQALASDEPPLPPRRAAEPAVTSDSEAPPEYINVRLQQLASTENSRRDHVSSSNNS